MKCKSCGTVLPENGVFCPNCGIRSDGKKECFNCKKLVEENVVFCTHCGARLDGKKKCSNCGEYFVGNFCPVCGVSIIKPTPVSTKKVSEKKEGVSAYSKVANILSPSLLLGALLVFFICSFFVGITYVSSDFDDGGNCNTFFFFKSIYDNINSQISFASQYIPAYDIGIYSFYMLFPTIFTTVFLSVNMLVSFGTLLFCSIKFGISIKKGKNVNISKPVFMCFSVFLCTAVFTALSLKVESYSSYEWTKTTMSAGSLSAIILGAILIGSSIVLTLIEKGRAYITNNLLKIALSIPALLLVVVSLFMFNSFICETTQYGSSSASISTNLYGMSNSLLTLYFYAPVENAQINNFNTLATSAVFGFVFTLLILICLSLLVYFILNALLSDRHYKKHLLVFSILFSAFTIGYFIVSLVAKNTFAIMYNSSTYTIGTIPVFVLSFVVLAISIVYTIVVKKKNISIEE